MKLGVVTTFPNGAWDVYAKEGLATFRQNWAHPLLVVLDDDTLVNQLQTVLNHPEDSAYIIGEPEQMEFIKRHIGKDDPKDYRKQLLRFSYKVFAMQAALTHYGDTIDYLVWLDADVLTHRPVTPHELEQWLPNGQIASYLGRKDWNTSETGFIIFDVKNGGREMIQRLVKLYTSDKVVDFPEWTDAYAFDVLRTEFNDANGKDVFRNLSEGIPGRDVFELSPLGQYMRHFKGAQKMQIAKRQPATQHSNAMHGGRFDVNDMKILTQNCVPNDAIKDNVTANLQIIENWLDYCQVTDEEIVICSAGPSLSVDEILPWYQKGVKIVAVKHALQKLLDAGIVPWACILLDPRGHVADFVQYPHKDINWFVASMVDPKVSQHLVKSGCKVFGYHAAVNADEVSRIPKGHMLVQGGSATATRGISLLRNLGFRKMHLYGYDCCYHKKPDLNDRKDNGKLRFEEVTLTANTWGGKQTVSTWWTEGQFLAQVQEMSKIYFPDTELELHAYGNGIIPWAKTNLEKEAAWRDYIREENRRVLVTKPNIDDWLETHGADKLSDRTERKRTPENS